MSVCVCVCVVFACGWVGVRCVRVDLMPLCACARARACDLMPLAGTPRLVRTVLTRTASASSNTPASVIPLYLPRPQKRTNQSDSLTHPPPLNASVIPLYLPRRNPPKNNVTDSPPTPPL